MRAVLVIGLAAVSMFLMSLPYYAGENPQIAMSADGVEIAFTVQGEGQPALVFVHGWCCDGSYWKNQVPQFAKTNKVVAIDLGGHGNSGTNRGEWTVASFGDDVVAVIEKLGLDEVVLIGHSMGGPVNIEAARRMPEKVIALVGVDTYQNLESEFSEVQKTQFLAAFQADFAGMTYSFVRGMFPADADSALVESVAHDMSTAPEEVGVGAMENLLGYKTSGKLEGLEIPVYCINSDRYPTDTEAGKRQAYSFDVKYMPGTGHFVMLEDPSTFNSLLDETISDVGGE